MKLLLPIAAVVSLLAASAFAQDLTPPTNVAKRGGMMTYAPAWPQDWSRRPAYTGRSGYRTWQIEKYRGLEEGGE